jgi:hypothetical protein
MKKGFILLAACAATWASCTKDSNRSMRERNISQGSWSVRTYSATNTAFKDSLIVIPVSPTLAGNEIYFKEGGDFVRRVRFSLNGQNIDSMFTTGKWAFQAADTKMQLTDTSLAGLYDVSRLDDSLLVLVKTVPNDNDTSHITYTTTFKRR